MDFTSLLCRLIVSFFNMTFVMIHLFNLHWFHTAGPIILKTVLKTVDADHYKFAGLNGI